MEPEDKPYGGRGYALRDPGVRPVSGTLAVPVQAGGRVVATLGLTYFSSVLDDGEVVDAYLDDLQCLAGQIAARL